MTKTTSYEISKKLKEAGFEADADYYWVEGIICVNAYVFSDYMTGGKKLCNSYDLETLLDALKQTRKRIMIVGISDNWEINFDYEFNKYSQENESLADTAGRLLLLLHEKNLIKF